MVRKTGVAIENDGLWEYLEAERVTDEGIRPRSRVVEELALLGMAARDILDEAPYEVERGRPEREMVRQALRGQIRRELEES
jgi:hypothetical protein